MRRAAIVEIFQSDRHKHTYTEKWWTFYGKVTLRDNDLSCLHFLRITTSSLAVILVAGFSMIICSLKIYPSSWSSMKPWLNMTQFWIQDPFVTWGEASSRNITRHLTVTSTPRPRMRTSSRARLGHMPMWTPWRRGLMMKEGQSRLKLRPYLPAPPKGCQLNPKGWWIDTL